ncbi:MAG: hypothetical protein ACXVPN_04225 [Bacteroidia bacterium]
MNLKEAQDLCNKYKSVYEDKEVRNLVNEDWYFLHSVEIAHLAPYDDTSYEVMVNTIKEGKIIPFKIAVAIRCFGEIL